MSEIKQDAEELVEWTNGRRIYPEVAEYFRTRRQADRAYEDAIAEADYAHQRAQRAASRFAEDEGRRFDYYGNDTDRRTHRTYTDARQAAYAQADAARAAESRELLTNSPHREVKWIADHCLFGNNSSEVRAYARNILEILPATTEEIWDEAKNNRGMCDEFDRLFDRAEADGVFNGGKKAPAAREMASLRNYARRTYGSSYAQELMPHIDRVIKALKECHEAEMADAKAEWQRLDEARAENATHNRSEAQRAVWERRRQEEANRAEEALRAARDSLVRTA